MHIPDGFLDVKTIAATSAMSATALGLALRQARLSLPPRHIPLIGLSAAFLFAAQMLNFPILAGTSGHLIGGVLVAALLGPAAAFVVLASVLMIQAFLFQDGGILVLGANFFNMALLGAGGGWIVYRCLAACLPGARGRIAAVAFAGWLSTVLAAMGCAGQLAWSGRAAWRSVFTAMTGIHMVIGLGEGLIGALVFAAILRTRPQLTEAGNPSSDGEKRGGLMRHGLMVSIGLALFVAPFACPWPDGLEAVAEKLGFAHAVSEPALPAPGPDYLFPGIQSAPLATALAGAVGAVVVFVMALLLARTLIPGKTGKASNA